MKMRVLVLANIALALAGVTFVATPAQASETALWNCCKSSTGGPRFCCAECCWFVQDCDSNSQCNGGGGET